MAQGIAVPSRVRPLSAAPVRPEATWVVYWMTAARRLAWNHALDRAVEWAKELARPLLVVEVFPCSGIGATRRNLDFVYDGMCEHAARLAAGPARYVPLVEREPGEAVRRLGALAAHAAAVVTDDAPVPAAHASVAAAADLPVAAEAVDSWGVLPMALTDRPPGTAHAFRRTVQRALPEALADLPSADPLGQPLPPPAALPPALDELVPRAEALLAGDRTALDGVPVDHGVPPAKAFPGGRGEALARLQRFLTEGLPRYAAERNHPDAAATSGLSPYLHHGHLAAVEVLLAVTAREAWSPADVRPPANGRRAGWWSLSEGAEAFLDQLVTWRELGAAFAHHVPEPWAWESLPGWARETLEAHATDPREHLYGEEELESAGTNDPVWNAAQRQLREEGIVHNYLRMVWGKRVLEWTPHPRVALELLVRLNDRWALDGGDPNSYSGIGWCFGRFDRPWGPAREIYGTVRYMSSRRTVQKLRMARYLEWWGAP